MLPEGGTLQNPGHSDVRQALIVRGPGASIRAPAHSGKTSSRLRQEPAGGSGHEQIRRALFQPFGGACRLAMIFL